MARDFVVHITALCPFCQTAYQVQATLRGQLVRCPSAACRKVFPVPEAEPPMEPPAAQSPSPQPSPPGNGSRSGSVGDMVPILPAEQAAPPAVSAKEERADGDWWQAVPPVRATPHQPAARSPAAPSSPPAPPTSEAPWWGDAPPPVRHPQAPVEPPASAAPTQRLRPVAQPPVETKQMPSPPQEKLDQPRELPPGVWEPPPVRRGSGDNDKDAPPVEEAAASESHRPRLSKRRAWLVIAVVFLLTFGILGGAGAWAWVTFHKSEEARSEVAIEHYRNHSYSSAADRFRELAQKFPDSPRIEEYRFLADWSAVCSAVADPDADLPPALDTLDQFIKKHKNKPLMVQFGRDAGQLLLKRTEAFAASNADPPDEKPLKAADGIEQLRRTVAALGPDALTKDEGARIDTDLSKVRAAVQKARKRREVLADLRKRAQETPMDSIKRARSLLTRMERELPGIGQDPEARTALAKLYETHLASVVYQPRIGNGPPPPPMPLGDDADTLLFAPLLPSAAPGTAPENDPIVLALVRGVLYALNQHNGALKWVMPVGIDTTVLPQRVPAWPGSPELLLVLSADTQTLSALNIRGDGVWEYHVGQPVLGRPIIIGQRAYLAAYDGSIHEIELAGGQLLGRWSLGQRLTCGGAREGDSNLIYFPADDSCIYVLDVKARRCVTILYDGHPSGSLRSEPVLVPPEGDTAPGYLILNQASGLDAMQLRVFELPLQDRHAAPLTLKPPPRLTGWTWFEPHQDGEKLAVLSDAGILGLFGIKQLGNQDQPLFPFLQPGGLDLSPFLQTGRELPRSRGRAQVVHMQGDDLWVLAHGRLQQIRLRLKWNDGPQAATAWKAPLPLGSPLHEPQRIEDRKTGLSTFYLVTQALEQQTCLATAVDETGKIVWQRQLGLVCQGEPLALTPPQGGSPILLALDQGGGLFALPPDKPHTSWRYLAPALEDNPRVPPWLLPAADGHSAYEIAAPGDGRKLIVRHIDWANDEHGLRFEQREASLLAAAGNSVLTPAGPPAIVGTQLMVPMTDGNLMRLSLTEEQPQLHTEFTWRQRLAPLTASCNVLALGGNRFLTTDGSRSLSVYEWLADKDSWQLLPKEGEPLKPLEDLIAAPPVLLPPGDVQQPRVAVADAAGMLHLFTVKPDGTLQRGPTWNLKGKITAGPFVYKTPEGRSRIGCILDQRQLVWLDPSKAEPLWTYATEGESIVGQPRRIEDVLVVALPSGRYLGLDPNTGRPKGIGYTLRASAAPAASPVPFAPGQMFTPLSDGTALLLPVELLKKTNHRVTENTEKSTEKKKK